MPDMANRARSLRVTASVLEIVAVTCSIGGVLAGVAIANHVRVTDVGRTHPQLAAGVAVILASVLLGAIGWCLGRAIGVFATDVATRNHVNISEPAPSRLPEFLRR
jgi:hypothetical protein